MAQVVNNDRLEFDALSKGHLEAQFAEIGLAVLLEVPRPDDGRYALEQSVRSHLRETRIGEQFRFHKIDHVVLLRVQFRLRRKAAQIRHCNRDIGLEANIACIVIAVR